MPRWFVYSTVSMLIWAMWSLMSTIVSRDLPGVMVQILSTAGLIPFGLALLFSRNLRNATHYGKGLALAFATGITGGAGNVLLYSALANGGPASLVFPIISVAPLVPILAAPFLFKERVRAIHMLAMTIALIAIVLLNAAPSPAGASGAVLTSKWMALTLASLVLYGVTFVTQKGASCFISEELSTVAFTCSFVVLAVFLSVTDSSLNWNMPVQAVWLCVGIGLLTGAGVLTLFAAYRTGKASIVTPYSQLYPVITVLAAVPLFNEPIDLTRGCGIVAALAAGVMLSMENTAAGA